MSREKRLAINLIGMDCASCGSRVSKAIGGIEGVKKIVPSPVLNKIFVYADEKTDVMHVRRRVEALGIRATLTVD